MPPIIPILLTALAVMSTARASSAQDIHVIAVEQGRLDQNDLTSQPHAKVMVSEAEDGAILVLLSRTEIDWHIMTDATSYISNVIINDRPATGQVRYKNIRFIAQSADLPIASAPFGRDFRALLERIWELTGARQISSFQAAFRAPEKGFELNRTIGPDTLSLDYLHGKLSTLSDLPEAIQGFAAKPHLPAQLARPRVENGQLVVPMRSGAGARFDIPPSTGLFLPSGALEDPASRTLYVLNSAGDSALYAIDLTTRNWTRLLDLEGFDAASLLIDQTSMSYILTGAFTRPGDILHIHPDGTRILTKINVHDFPGLTDLYDYQSQYAATLEPKRLSNGWLALTAVDRENPNRSRRYAVHLARQEVRLLSFEN